MDPSVNSSPEIIAPAGAVAPRRLAAILAADIKGYSRLMARDEEGTVARVTGQFRDVIAPAVERHSGQVVKTMGDGFLAVFQSPLDALRCALALQDGLEAPARAPGEEPMRHRIGINLGDVISTGNDLYGDTINVAARLQELASPGGICISGSVYDQVRSRLPCAYRPRGDERLKNIADPVRAYDVIPGSAVAAPIRRVRWRVVAAAGAALAALAVLGWLMLPHRAPPSVAGNTLASSPRQGLPDIFTSEARRDVVYQRMAAALAGSNNNGWMRVERLAVVAGVTEEEAHDILAEHFPRDVMLRKGPNGKLLAHLAEH